MLLEGPVEKLQGRSLFVTFRDGRQRADGFQLLAPCHGDKEPLDGS